MGNAVLVPYSGIAEFLGSGLLDHADNEELVSHAENSLGAHLEFKFSQTRLSRGYCRLA